MLVIIASLVLGGSTAYKMYNKKKWEESRKNRTPEQIAEEKRRSEEFNKYYNEHRDEIRQEYEEWSKKNEEEAKQRERDAIKKKAEKQHRAYERAVKRVEFWGKLNPYNNSSSGPKTGSGRDAALSVDRAISHYGKVYGAEYYVQHVYYDGSDIIVEVSLRGSNDYERDQDEVISKISSEIGGANNGYSVTIRF